MAIIPIPEIEAALLARGLLVKHFLREASGAQQGPSLPLKLVDGLPRSRTLTNGLGPWVAKYLNRKTIDVVAAIPPHLRWEALRDEFLSDEDLLDLAERLEIAYVGPKLRHSDFATAETFKDWHLKLIREKLSEAA
jgi:hypothetical protein